MSTQIDHQVLAISRLITQYREASNLIAYIEAFTAQSNEIEVMFQELLEDRWVDTAIGAQLDILGEIVGQPRVIPAYDTIPYFGFDTSIGAGTFGTLAVPATGELFRRVDDLEFVAGTLTDTNYRIYIKAKILKNITDTSIDSVIGVSQAIFPTLTLTITESGVNAHLAFNTALTDAQKLTIVYGNLYQKPAGVSYTYEDTIGNFA